MRVATWLSGWWGGGDSIYNRLYCTITRFIYVEFACTTGFPVLH